MTGDPQVRLEVGPVDKVAREDINKFLREMTEESSAQGNNIPANLEIKKTIIKTQNCGT